VGTPPSFVASRIENIKLGGSIIWLVFIIRFRIIIVILGLVLLSHYHHVSLFKTSHGINKIIDEI
jgi:hypothetical protein